MPLANQRYTIIYLYDSYSVCYYYQKALTLAKECNTLRATLSDFEFTIEQHSHELAALHVEQKKLKEELAEEKERNSKERRTHAAMDG